MPKPEEMLYCEVCGRPIESDDGWSFDCEVCGREGFCRHCAEVENHECDPMQFWIEDDEAHPFDSYFDEPDPD